MNGARTRNRKAPPFYFGTSQTANLYWVLGKEKELSSYPHRPDDTDRLRVSLIVLPPHPLAPTAHQSKVCDEEGSEQSRAGEISATCSGQGGPGAWP